MRYTAAQTLEDAIRALMSGDTAVIAGGTDLVVGSRSGRRALPDSVVAIHEIAALRELISERGTLTVGALVNHETLYRSAEVRQSATALADGAALIGSPATRHLGTLGGNLANGSPAMDTGAPLVVLGATVLLRSALGERRLDVEDLFLGPGQTRIGAEELLVSVHIPAIPKHAGSAYVRLEYRQAMEITVAGAAAAIVLEPGGKRIAAARLALSSVAPTVVSVPEAERLLVEGSATPAAFEAAGRLAAAAARPISDVRAAEEYRRAMVSVVVRRALGAATARARGAEVPVPASRQLDV